MAERVVVFIDAQNMYKGARYAFFDEGSYHINGQFSPQKMGSLLVSKGKLGHDRILEGVRIYTGRPDPSKQPKVYSPHMRQCAIWSKDGVSVIPRMLRYPRNWPLEKEGEKGIDVAMAIDFVAMAIDGKYDVGIMVTRDTDLTPALEYVARKRPNGATVEVAAWQSPRVRGRLSIKGLSIWCHWLNFSDYQSIADTRDYNVA